MDACGGGGDGGWTPSQPSMSSHLRGTRLLFFSQMMARVCGGGPFPSYRAQNGPRGERAHLRPRTQT